MRILFTKNKLPLSWLIRWGTNSPVSHMAIELDDKLIFQSNLIGVHVCFAKGFKEKNTVVSQVTLEVTPAEEDEVYYKSIAAREGKPWDFGAFFYFAWVYFKQKVFKAEIPKENPLQSDDADLCTELVYCLPKRIVESLKLTDISMATPHGVFRAFVASQSKKLAS